MFSGKLDISKNILKIKKILFFFLMGKKNLSTDCDIKELMDEYRIYISDKKNVKYMLDFCELSAMNTVHKFVGIQQNEEKLYFIPNDMDSILVYDKDNHKEYRYGTLSKDKFKWTGGAVWNNAVYTFPRSSNYMLCISLKDDKISEISCPMRYEGEHHYGGVCTSDGRVFQPPRNTDHFLVWELGSKICRKLQLAPPKLNIILRYCGGIIHPNGFAYFFPERRGRVIKLNLKTEEWCFIGKVVTTMVFDAKVAADGNIYGYSAYCKGIMKITVEKNKVEMIHEEITAGAYGTKAGVNGKLYSIPGDGEEVWEYDPLTNELNCIYKMEDKTKAKYAGGITSRNGDIWGAAAQKNKVFHLVPNKKEIEIPEELYLNFFVDNY